MAEQRSGACQRSDLAHALDPPLAADGLYTIHMQCLLSTSALLAANATTYLELSLTVLSNPTALREDGMSSRTSLDTLTWHNGL